MNGRLAVQVAVALVAGTATCSAAEPETYLFDLLRHPQPKSALKQVLKGKAVPDWVKAFMARGDGVVAPMKILDISGRSFRLDHLCKPHDCAGNVLSVLWAPGDRKVWAALVQGGGAPVFFGNPSPEQSQVLTSDAKAG